MPVHLALEEGLVTSAALLFWACRLSEPAGLQNSFSTFLGSSSILCHQLQPYVYALAVKAEVLCDQF